MDVKEILRWGIAVASLLGALFTALNELPHLTAATAVPAVLMAIGAWVSQSPWDQPKAMSVRFDELPRELQEHLAEKRGRR